jgi:NTE family protein
MPVRVARALGAERVIAVDVTFRLSEARLNGLVDRLFQTGLVLVRTLAAQEASEADVPIEPQLPPQEEVHIDNRLALVAAGERAALAALPHIERLLAAAPKAAAPPGDLRRCEAMRRTS